jgi:hypothetical protein
MLVVLWATDVLESGSMTASQRQQVTLIGAFMYFVWMFFLVPPITAWHRLIILGKEHKESRIRISFSRSEWSYLWRVAIILWALNIFATLAGSFPAVAMAAYYEIISEEVIEELISGSRVLCFPLGILGIAGYFLMLPAAAINRPLTFGEVGQYWKGNWIRLWVVYVLALAPEVIIDFTLLYSESITGKVLIGGIIDGYQMAIYVNYYIFFTITIGAMSLAYKELVEGKTDPENSKKARRVKGDDQ